MMPAAKHGDPQLGVDIHLCVVPPSPSPVPLPTPHVSVIFDPFDYIPYIGATVTVCGMKRATAGTNGMAVHIPPGFPFAPKLPDKDDELFMGSATVVADGDPFSFIGVPVLGCQVAGMLSIPRLKKKGSGKKMMLLPTTFNLAIPTTVFVGGPPTISLMGMAFKAGFKALGKFAKSGLFKRIRQRVFGNMKPGFLKCKVLRAEPVNILTGEVAVEQEDFTLPGRIPIEWVRSYTSGNQRSGACGHGWETLADIRLEVDSVDGGVALRHPTVGPLFFSGLPVAIGEGAAELELMDGARLSDHGTEFRVRTKEHRVYHFPKRLASPRSPGAEEYPIGRIVDLCGNWLAFERQGQQVVAIQESAGRRLELVTRRGLLREVALVDAATAFRHVFVRYEYDEAGDLASVVDATGHPYTFGYDEHHLIRHTDCRGLSFYYEYDPAGPDGWRVVHAWGDGGLYEYRFSYDDTLKERRITDSLGHVSIVKLDESGLPIAEIDALGGLTAYEYDRSGRTIAVVDPALRRTEYEYDERGNTVRLTRPDGTTISTRYDENDRTTDLVDPNGAVWLQRWDDRGLLVQQTSPLGHVSTYEYDRTGQLVGFANPRGARTELHYDVAGQLIELTDTLGQATRFARDCLGYVIAKVDALNRHTRYRYDAKGRLTEMEPPSGATIQCSYDGEGNLVRYSDENGGVTRLEYLGLGELTRRILPDGHAVEYLHDTEGWLVGVRNQRGELYRLRRDASGRIVEELDYWGQSRRYVYDGSGYLVASLDPLGQRIDFVCDPLGHIVQRTLQGLPGSREPFVERFAYDANSRLVFAANPHVEIQCRYDAQGRLLIEEQAHARGERFAVEHAYDAAGNRIKRTTSAGHTVEYAYDLLDRVSEIRIDGGEPMRTTRNGLGQIIREDWAPDLARHCRYGVDGLLHEQSLIKDGVALFATQYDYDLAGNLTQRTDSRFGTDRYAYDPVGRVLEHADPQGRLRRFFNDPGGDRLIARIEGAPADGMREDWSRKGRYDDKHYRFDRAGNLRLKQDAECRLELTWDANQRLAGSRITRADGRRADTVYGYDPLGRRLFKETAGRRTWFGWDGDALALDASGEQIREFVYEPRSFKPRALILATAVSTVETFLYGCDPNGCPTRVIDADGEVHWSAAYGAWGKTSERQHRVANPLRLQGQYADEETGLYYNRHRYYDCDAGLYISVDPIGLAGGANLHTLGDNALTWIDPLGLAACSLADARRLADQVPDDLKKIFKCKEFAAELRERMQKEGLNAEEVILKSDTGYIFSDAAGKVISTNGDHVGIKVGDHVFDNLNPQGIHVDKWMQDLGVGMGFPGMRSPSTVPF